MTKTVHNIVYAIMRTKYTLITYTNRGKRNNMKQFLALLVSLFTSTLGNAQTTPSQIISDIDQLQELVESNDVHPFWITSKENFNANIAQAKDIISEKDSCDESCFIELLKFVASIKHGHSSTSGESRYELFGYLPFTAKWFDGNLHIVKTSKEYEKVLGHRVTMVNGMGIDQVLFKLRKVVPHANDSRFKKFVGSYLHLPGLLYGLEITENPHSALFTFPNGKKSFDLEILSMSTKQEEEVVFVSFLEGKSTYLVILT